MHTQVTDSSLAISACLAFGAWVGAWWGWTLQRRWGSLAGGFLASFLLVAATDSLTTLIWPMEHVSICGLVILLFLLHGFNHAAGASLVCLLGAASLVNHEMPVLGPLFVGNGSRYLALGGCICGMLLADILVCARRHRFRHVLSLAFGALTLNSMLLIATFGWRASTSPTLKVSALTLSPDQTQLAYQR